jgi:Lipocalin-like domain
MSRADQHPDADRAYASTGALGQQLVGVWSLLSYADQQDGKADAHPFGLDPQGILIYTADGFVSAQLMDPNRAQVRSAAWHGGDPEELAQAAAGYIAYCGRYVLDEAQRTITHIPTVALLPQLVGNAQRRKVSLDAGLLTLLTERLPSPSGALVSSRLEWKKIPRWGPPDALSHASATLRSSKTLACP